MNNGILVQDVYGKIGFEERLPKSLSGPPSVVNMPYHYPPANDWKNNTQQFIILVHDTTKQNNTTISVPYGVQNFTTDIIIDWGDGTTDKIIWTDSGNARSTFHTYSSHGVYTVIISGRLGRLGRANPIGISSLIKCYSFGNLGLTNIATALAVAPNLIEAPAALPSTVTSMVGLFLSCTIFNDEKIKYWDTTNTTNMNSLFVQARNFNQDLGSWNTSNVTDMASMFQGAVNFDNGNSDSINNWNVSNVTNMSTMFDSSAFNQPINNWNTSNVTTMASMFLQNVRFNKNLDNWNVRKVTTFQSMFQSATSFNGSMSGWAPGADTTGTNCTRMFFNATNFTGIGLETWDTSKVTNMSIMFRDCPSFNANISGWNTSSVTNIGGMFYNCYTFNQNLGSWNVGAVTNMSEVFHDARAFVGSGLGNWNTSSVTNMSRMFFSADVFNTNINSWDTSNVTLMNDMFASTPQFNQPLNSWNVRKVTNFSTMFQGAASFNSSLSGWALGADTSGTTCQSMFQSATSFNQDLSSWDTSKVTNMAGMFNGTNAFNQNIAGWDVSNVTNMSVMFINNGGFNNGGSSDINNWNVSKVTTMANMFNSATPFNQPISNWNLAGLNINTALDGFMSGKTGAIAYSTANYDALLIGWNNNKLASANGVANWRSDLRPNFGGAKYTSGGAAAAARAALVSYGWTITDGGPV